MTGPIDPPEEPHVPPWSLQVFVQAIPRRHGPGRFICVCVAALGLYLIVFYKNIAGVQKTSTSFLRNVDNSILRGDIRSGVHVRGANYTGNVDPAVVEINASDSVGDVEHVASGVVGNEESNSGGERGTDHAQERSQSRADGERGSDDRSNASNTTTSNAGPAATKQNSEDVNNVDSAVVEIDVSDSAGDVEPIESSVAGNGTITSGGELGNDNAVESNHSPADSDGFNHTGSGERPDDRLNASNTTTSIVEPAAVKNTSEPANNVDPAVIKIDVSDTEDNVEPVESNAAGNGTSTSGGELGVQDALKGNLSPADGDGYGSNHTGRGEQGFEGRLNATDTTASNVEPAATKNTSEEPSDVEPAAKEQNSEFAGDIEPVATSVVGNGTNTSSGELAMQDALKSNHSRGDGGSNRTGSGERGSESLSNATNTATSNVEPAAAKHTSEPASDVKPIAGPTISRTALTHEQISLAIGWRLL